MSLFLLTSFPVYLFLTINCSPNPAIKLVRIVRYCFFGLCAYLPVYLFVRIIPDPDFFPWDIWQVFFGQLFHSRETCFRLAAALILIVLILRRYYRNDSKHDSSYKNLSDTRSSADFAWVATHANELLCWLTGYFLAANIRDLLLLGPLPTTKDLFYNPLSRILFSQFLVFALEFLQVIRYPDDEIRQRARREFLIYLFAAFLGMSVFVSVAMLLNSYWGVSLILLVILFICFGYAYQFSAIKQKYRH